MGVPKPPPPPSLVCSALRGKISVYNELEANFKVKPPKNGVSSGGEGSAWRGRGLPQNPGNPLKSQEGIVGGAWVRGAVPSTGVPPGREI